MIVAAVVNVRRMTQTHRYDYQATVNRPQTKRILGVHAPAYQSYIHRSQPVCNSRFIYMPITIAL